MYAIIHKFMDRFEIPARGERVLCAVSGGGDSVALLHLLAHTAPGEGFEVTVAHFDHGLRGPEGERDAGFVAGLARALDLPCEVGRVGRATSGSRGRSPEEAARLSRRRFLIEAADRTGAHHIALGHTMDDQAETVLMRALTGSSTTGLQAMGPVSPDGRWIRPLLGTRRRALRHWLRDQGHEWMEDATNRVTDAMRNRTRLEILPLATARLNPRAPEALARLGSEAAEIEAWLMEQATAALQDAGVTDPSGHNQVETAGLRPYHAIVRRYALRVVYERVRGERTDLTREHLLAMDRLLFSPGEVHLPGGIRAIGEHGRLRFGVLSEPVPRALGDDRPLPVPVGHTLSLPGVGLQLRTEALGRESLEGLPSDDRAEVVFDAERLDPPLEVRAWAPGDRFTPLGMDGSQKVSDLFINLGIPRSDRIRVPILVDGRGILWVVGHRRSNRAPVTPDTKRVLRIVAGPGQIRIG